MTIEDGTLFLDGGSILLSLRDSEGVQRNLLLAQHRIPMAETDPRLPGRLYLDGRMIAVRSDEEAQLLAKLKRASISSVDRKHELPRAGSGPMHVLSEDIADFLAAAKVSTSEAIKHLVTSLIQFVESEEYVRLARDLEDHNSA